MKIEIFNISAIRPSEDELDGLNSHIEDLSPDRTWMEVVESPNGPVWSIAMIFEEEHSRSKPEPLPDLSESDTEIYEALLDWRRHTAQRENLPEYFIMHNRTLRELAIKRPIDVEELVEIRGIGKWKARQYGEAILTVIEAIAKSQGDELDLD